MCGIVGYLGPEPAAGLLLQGLKRLEYRGYDSAGVATCADGSLHRQRAVGQVVQLQHALEAHPLPGHVGIAHTRWATHGEPTEANAHPHLDADGRIALVHNGIIENHRAIRDLLQAEGIVFRSATDTEALAQLVGYLYRQQGDLVSAVQEALQQVRGTFGIAVLAVDEPQRLIAARRGSPLIVGLAQDSYLVASDASAIVEHTDRVVYLQENEMAVLGPGREMDLRTIDDQPVQPAIHRLELTLEQIELGPHQHYMHKEIHEQPASLTTTLAGRCDVDNGRVVLGGLREIERQLSRFERMVLFGCGTAWHAALVGEYLFEELARLPVEVEYASELRYRNPMVNDRTLAVAVSQSGETADTLAAMRELTLKGATVLGLVNVVGSSIARETDAGVYLRAGPEIGVASTKAFTSQVAALSLMALDLGRRRHLGAERTAALLADLQAMPERVQRCLALEDACRVLAHRFADREHWLYLGRGVNYPVALEGALKLKEISYIHAEGMPAAEIKHGPLALIEPGMPVVFVAPQDHTYDKVLANVEEVKGRGGRVIAVISEGDGELTRLADEVLSVPTCEPLLSPLVTCIPLQLIAYHAALARGHDVDKPRNLAKSVTVE